MLFKTSITHFFVQIGVIICLITADRASATEPITLEDLKQLAINRSPFLAIKRQQVQVIERKGELNQKRSYPDIGFVIGLSSNFDDSRQTTDGVGFSYLKYRILDGGELKKSKLLIDAKKYLHMAELALLAREVGYIVEKAYFKRVILKETLAELDDLQKRNIALEKTLRRMVLAGSANDLIVSGFALETDRLRLHIASLVEAINDAELLLLKYVSRQELDRLLLRLPKLEDAINLPRQLVDNTETMGLRERATEARVAAQSAVSSWIPELSVEGRYGVMPIGDREMTRRMEGSFLLSADWSLFSGIRRQDELAIAKTEESLFDSELNVIKQSTIYDLDALTEKIKIHVKNLERFAQHQKNLSNYAERLARASEHGLVSIFEAKATINELLELTNKIGEEKLNLWGQIAELRMQLE